MKTLNRIALNLIAVAAVAGFLAATANAQYYTPLRYDLRFTSPTYIPSGALQFGPSNPDPYAFGAPQYGNLGMTGNLRAGKSFRGNVPYSAIGSELSATLPSDSLSRFKRDSFSIADIGSGIEYGIPEVYIPSSSSVTNLPTAMNRFAAPPPGARAPYTLPNVNTAYVAPPPPTPSGGYVGFGVPEGTLLPPGTSPRQVGLSIPQGALAWVDALIAGRVVAPVTPVPTLTPAEIENARQQDKRQGLPGEMPDLRIGIGPPQTAYEEGARLKPAAEMEMRTLEENEAEILRLTPGAAKPRKRAAEGGTPAVATPAARPTEAPDEEARPPVPGEPTVKLPPTPGPYRAPVTYPIYVDRARAAMKESNYDQAAAFYSAAIALKPNEPDVFFGRVYAMLGLRSYLQAAVVLQGQLLKHATWLKTMPDIRAAYATPEAYGRILDQLKALLETDPDSPSYSFLLGYVYFAGGDNAAARPYLEHAAKLRGEKQGPEKLILTAMESGKDR